MAESPAGGGTPTAAGAAARGFSLLSGLRKPLSGGGAASPTPSSPMGGDASPTASLSGTARSLFPSFSHGVQKRQIIKDLDEQLSILRMQVQQQGNELGKVHQAYDAEKTARVALQERLNMQFFKSNLLVDMLVLGMLERPAQQHGVATGAEAALAPAVVQMS